MKIYFVFKFVVLTPTDVNYRVLASRVLRVEIDIHSVCPGRIHRTVEIFENTARNKLCLYYPMKTFVWGLPADIGTGSHTRTLHEREVQAGGSRRVPTHTFTAHTYLCGNFIIYFINQRNILL